MDLKQRPVTVMTPLVETIRDLSIKSRMWVAGGAARRVAQGQNLGQGDIDIFMTKLDFPSSLFQIGKALGAPTRINGFANPYRNVADLEIIDEVKRGLNSSLLTTNSNDDFVSNLRSILENVKNKRKAKLAYDAFHVHLVEHETFSTGTNILGSFNDFTICQFITDGYRVIGSREAWWDLDHGILDVIKGCNAKGNSYSRLSKYIEYGFTPAPGVVEWSFNTSKVNISDNFWISYHE